MKRLEGVQFRSSMAQNLFNEQKLSKNNIITEKRVSTIEYQNQG